MKRPTFILLFLLCFTAFGMPFELKIVKEVGPTAITKWSSTSIPIPFFIDSRGSDNVPFAQTSTALRNSFSTWQNIAGTTIGFNFLGSKTGAQASVTDEINHILWVEKDWRFSSAILAITLTSFFIEDPPTFVDADILFNGVNFQWSTAPTTPSGKIDIQGVAQHEIGHFIGLQHSQLRNAKMLPRFSPGRILSIDDQNGVRFLYPDSVPVDFRALTPANGSVLLGGPNPASAGFPFTTFRWTTPAAFSNFVIQFSPVAGFTPPGKVKSFPKGLSSSFEETTTVRSQLKTLAGVPKKLFWRVQADTPAGKAATPTLNFTFE